MEPAEIVWLVGILPAVFIAFIAVRYCDKKLSGGHQSLPDGVICVFGVVASILWMIAVPALILAGVFWLLYLLSKSISINIKKE